MDYYALTIVNFEMKCSKCLRPLRGEMKLRSNSKAHKDLFCWFPDCKAQNDFREEYIVYPPHSREHSHFDVEVIKKHVEGAPK